eukprot:316833_1
MLIFMIDISWLVITFLPLTTLLHTISSAKLPTTITTEYPSFNSTVININSTQPQTQHYYQAPDTFGPSQIHTQYFLARDQYVQTHTQYFLVLVPYGSTQTLTQHYYQAPDTFGPSQTHTLQHKHIHNIIIKHMIYLIQHKHKHNSIIMHMVHHKHIHIII